MEGRGASHSVSTKIVLWRHKDEMSSKLQSPSNAINTTLGWVRLNGLADVWSRSWFPAQGRTCYLAHVCQPGPGNVVFLLTRNSQQRPRHNSTSADAQIPQTDTDTSYTPTIPPHCRTTVPSFPHTTPF